MEESYETYETCKTIQDIISKYDQYFIIDEQESSTPDGYDEFGPLNIEKTFYIVYYKHGIKTVDYWTKDSRASPYCLESSERYLPVIGKAMCDREPFFLGPYNEEEDNVLVPTKVQKVLEIPENNIDEDALTEEEYRVWMACQ